MARLIKSGKNAGVIVVTKRDRIDPNDMEFLALCRLATAQRKQEVAEFNALVEDLGSVRAANAFLRQS